MLNLDTTKNLALWDLDYFLRSVSRILLTHQAVPIGSKHGETHQLRAFFCGKSLTNCVNICVRNKWLRWLDCPYSRAPHSVLYTVQAFGKAMASPPRRKAVTRHSEVERGTWNSGSGSGFSLLCTAAHCASSHLGVGVSDALSVGTITMRCLGSKQKILE